MEVTQVTSLQHFTSVEMPRVERRSGAKTEYSFPLGDTLYPTQGDTLFIFRYSLLTPAAFGARRSELPRGVAPGSAAERPGAEDTCLRRWSNVGV